MEGYDKEILLKLVKMEMPFGKYKGQLLVDLPDHYLAWFQRKGFPQGKLGEFMALTLEIKSNGLGYLLPPLKEMTE